MDEKNTAVYIVDGSRTPFLKAKGVPGPFRASDLAVGTGKALLARQPFSSDEFDEVIVGCAIPGADEANIARLIALRLGCGETTPAWTVQRNCASGLQSIDSAYQLIAQGRSHLMLAGGTESMSHAPLLWPVGMVRWLGQLSQAKSMLAKLARLSRFKLSYLKPRLALLQGLTDPVVDLSMGQTAEILAKEFQIGREAMDEFAERSHQRVLASTAAGLLDEVTPLFDEKGNSYDRDDGVRKDSRMAKLARLKPVFDKPFGQVTAGNSSQVTDGACLLVLASEKAVNRYNLKPLVRIVDVQWAGLDPRRMGLGPIHAATPLLVRHGLDLSSIDYWEINEAFAAQVLACLKAWEDLEYCKQQLGLDQAMGVLDQTQLNVDGGAIALGHPIGASGARITLHLANTLVAKQGHRGVACLCIGGGQGGAILLERVASS